MFLFPAGKKDYLSFQDNSAHYSEPMRWLAAKLHKSHNPTSAKIIGCTLKWLTDRTKYIHVTLEREWKTACTWATNTAPCLHIVSGSKCISCHHHYCSWPPLQGRAGGILWEGLGQLNYYSLLQTISCRGMEIYETMQLQFGLRCMQN